jgi:hypothetical protein
MFHSIEEALTDLKNGKVIIVVDEKIVRMKAILLGLPIRSPRI